MEGLDAEPLLPGTHTLTAGGLAQRYHVHGRGPVCLVHPGGPGVFWEYLRMPALERDLTMVYLEPIGTGASSRLASHPHGYSRSFYASALHRLVDHLGQGQVLLLGHSHGGFVAQRYALDHIDRLAGLILYASAPVTGDEHTAEATRQIQQFAARNADNPELPDVLAALQTVSSLTDDRELTEALQGLLPAYFADYWGKEKRFAPFRAAASATYISHLDANLTPDLIDDRDALASLVVPTLVLAGAHDVICGARWARELSALIPNSRLVVLEGSGHLAHVEEPSQFAQAVTTFISSLLGGPPSDGRPPAGPHDRPR